MRMFGLFGKKAKYESLNWFENFMNGHLKIGSIIIYGSNAMCWSVNIYTKKWGYICFTLPSKLRKKRKLGWYYYLSPNGTPWACTYYLGSDKDEKIKSQIRKLNFGHNFNTNNEETYKKLSCLNEKFEWLRISEYDLIKFGKK